MKDRREVLGLEGQAKTKTTFRDGLYIASMKYEEFMGRIYYEVDTNPQLVGCGCAALGLLVALGIGTLWANDSGLTKTINCYLNTGTACWK